MLTGKRCEQDSLIRTNGLGLRTRRLYTENIFDVDHRSSLQEHVILIVSFRTAVRDTLNANFNESGCASQLGCFRGDAIELIRDFERPRKDDAVLLRRTFIEEVFLCVWRQLPNNAVICQFRLIIPRHVRNLCIRTIVGEFPIAIETTSFDNTRSSDSTIVVHVDIDSFVRCDRYIGRMCRNRCNGK